MPFTFVHPAAILPVARSPLVRSALVIGAMAPDLPYFVSLQWIHGDLNLTLTHDPLSLLWLDPLLALVLLAGFHLLGKEPLAALLPRAVAGRVLPEVVRFVWRGADVAAWIILSVAVGTATHLAWDQLCDAFGMAWSARLNLASDLVGGVVLLGWLVLWWRRTPPQPIGDGRLLPPRLRTVVLGALLLVTVVAAVWGTRHAETPREFVGTVGTALGAAVVLYALTWQLTRKLSR